MRLLVNMSDIICSAYAIHLLLVELVLGQLVGLRQPWLIRVQNLLVVNLGYVLSMVSVHAEPTRQ